MTTETCITLSARIHFDAARSAHTEVEIRPSFVTEAIPSRASRHHEPSPVTEAFTVVFLDVDEVTLASHPLRPLLQREQTDPRSIVIVQTIPWPERVGAVQIVRNGEIAVEVDVAADVPEITAVSADVLRPDDREYVVDWTLDRSPPPDSEYLVRYSPDDRDTWYPLFLGPLEGPRVVFELNDLPGGAACLFEVVIAHGVTSRSTIGGPFPVLEPPARLTILHPVAPPGEPAVTLAADDLLRLSGAVSSSATDVPEEMLEWWASGTTEPAGHRLGSGRALTIRGDDLSPGVNTVTFRVDDPAGPAPAQVLVIRQP